MRTLEEPVKQIKPLVDIFGNMPNEIFVVREDNIKIIAIMSGKTKIVNSLNEQQGSCKSQGEKNGK